MFSTLRKRSIALEVMLVFLVILGMTIAAGYLLRSVTRHLVDDARDAVWETSVPSSFVFRMMDEQWMIHQTIASALVRGTAINALKAEIGKREQETDKRWNELLGWSLYFPPAPKAAIERTTVKLNAFRASYRQTLAMLELGNAVGARANSQSAEADAVLMLAGGVSGLLQTMGERIDIMQQRMENTATRGVTQFIWIALIIGALLLLSYGVIHFRIIRPILSLNGTMEALAAGDLSASVQPAPRKDEIGRMVETVGVFKEGLLKINRLFNALEQSQEANTRTNKAMMRALIGLAGARDNETGAHLDRTQLYVSILCQTLAADPEFSAELDAEAVQHLVAAAPLHDIGKVAIPDHILHKPGRLTDDEFAIMKTHVVEGLSVIDKVIRDVGVTPYLKATRDVIAGHHERYDGKGYPYQVAGRDIPLGGRIMALADVYDALRSARVYKAAMSHEQARQILIEGSATHFDPKVVAAFLQAENQFRQIADTMGDQAQADPPAEVSLKSA